MKPSQAHNGSYGDSRTCDSRRSEASASEWAVLMRRRHSPTQEPLAVRSNGTFGRGLRLAVATIVVFTLVRTSPAVAHTINPPPFFNSYPYIQIYGCVAGANGYTVGWNLLNYGAGSSTGGTNCSRVGARARGIGSGHRNPHPYKTTGWKYCSSGTTCETIAYNDWGYGYVASYDGHYARLGSDTVTKYHYS